MEAIPLETQTLYGELLEQLMAYEAHRSIGHLSGSFVTKKIKGKDYYYFQYSAPGGVTKQAYLGRRDAVLKKILSRFENERPQSLDEQKNIHRLSAQLRSGGVLTTDAASARVIKGLADAGIFKYGGVLVGTHAFVVLGNLLGYRWKQAGLKTQDLDIASSPILSVAIPDSSPDLPQVLESLELGFLPVPPLNPKHPSTSFKVRGKALRVDLLTPASQPQQRKPISIPGWKASAQPLPFLDFLLAETVRGAVVDGGGILVEVPTPARYALHKLITAQERSVVFHTKKEKDLSQAAQILQVLKKERPGDLTRAWEALKKRGAAWTKKANRSLSQIKSTII